MAGIFSTLSVARSALQAQDAALRVTGQNIANSGTEGYSRRRVHLAPAEGGELAGLSIGGGVEIERIERMFDAQLEAGVRDAGSGLRNLETKSRVLGTVESVLNDLQENGLSPALNKFFAALNDLAATPEDHALRNQVIAAGDALSESFHFAASRLREVREDLNSEVKTAVGRINGLTSEIAKLNKQIVAEESGKGTRGTANDLRDRRNLAIRQLSDLVNLKAVETSTGAVNVMVEGDWLVFGQETNELVLEENAESGVLLSTARLSSGGKLFAPKDGTLAGLLEARDTIVPGTIGDVNKLAGTVVEQVNRIHSQGEGLTRFSRLTGATRAASPTAALNQAGLPFQVNDGRFTLTVKNENTGHVDLYDIPVDLSGSASPMSLNDVADRINSALSGEHPEVEARVTNDFRLEIKSTSNSLTFGFSEDSSGVLSACGMNTFFTGRDAETMGVNSLIKESPEFLATGKGGGVSDNSCVLELLSLRDRKVMEGATLENWWQGRVGALGVRRAALKDQAENQAVIFENLANRQESLSGVNIDEEAINMIKHQRAYQGAARLLTVVDELVATLLRAV